MFFGEGIVHIISNHYIILSVLCIHIAMYIDIVPKKHCKGYTVPLPSMARMLHHTAVVSAFTSLVSFTNNSSDLLVTGFK